MSEPPRVTPRIKMPWRPIAEDRHAPLAARSPLLRGPSVVAEYVLDEIEDFCVACTAVWGASGWTHDRGCPVRKDRSVAADPAARQDRRMV